jgi:hypothetical protein
MSSNFYKGSNKKPPAMNNSSDPSIKDASDDNISDDDSDTSSDDAFLYTDDMTTQTSSKNRKHRRDSSNSDEDNSRRKLARIGQPIKSIGDGDSDSSDSDSTSTLSIIADEAKNRKHSLKSDDEGRSTSKRQKVRGVEAFLKRRKRVRDSDSDEEFTSKKPRVGESKILTGGTRHRDPDVKDKHKRLQPEPKSKNAKERATTQALFKATITPKSSPSGKAADVPKPSFFGLKPNESDSPNPEFEFGYAGKIKPPKKAKSRTKSDPVMENDNDVKRSKYLLYDLQNIYNIVDAWLVDPDETDGAFFRNYDTLEEDRIESIHSALIDLRVWLREA